LNEPCRWDDVPPGEDEEIGMDDDFDDEEEERNGQREQRLAFSMRYLQSLNSVRHADGSITAARILYAVRVDLKDAQSEVDGCQRRDRQVHLPQREDPVRC
jgi:hypothetical protein